jgi:hypothetical protein
VVVRDFGQGCRRQPNAGVAGGDVAPVWGRVLDSLKGDNGVSAVRQPCRCCGSPDFTVSGSRASDHLREPILGVVKKQEVLGSSTATSA